MLLCFDKYFNLIDEILFINKQLKKDVNLDSKVIEENKQNIEYIKNTKNLNELSHVIEDILKKKSFSNQNFLFNKWQSDIIINNPFKVLSFIMNNIDKKNIYINLYRYKKEFYLREDSEDISLLLDKPKLYIEKEEKSNLSKLFNKSINEDIKSLEDKHIKDVFPEYFFQWTQNIYKGGYQGKLGLFRVKYTNIDILYKFSVNLDYTTVQEYMVMLGLNDISRYCPHYSRCYGIIEKKVDLNSEKHSNPFEIYTKYPKNRDILLMEFITESDKYTKFLNKLKNVDNLREEICKLHNVRRKKKHREEYEYSFNKYSKCRYRSKIVISNMFQVLIAIYIGQIKKRFTHYDLHSDNILLKKCNKDAVFFYIVDENTQFLIPSYGYISKIIDFGFSHLIDNNDQYFWSPMSYTNNGFTGYCFNQHRDYILFLNGIVRVISKNKKTPVLRKICNIFKTIYGKLHLDENGWMNDKDCYTDLICDRCQKGLKIFRSSIFYKYPTPINDIITSLIVLPLKNKEYNNISLFYSIVIKEFEIIENQISDNLTKLYIFREIIDSIRFIKTEYLSDEDNISMLAVKKLKKIIYQKIDSVSKYVNLSKLNIELLICSILSLKNCIEGYLYHLIKNDKYNQNYYDNIYKIKDKDKLGNPFIRNINCLEIIKIYEKHINLKYEYNKNTRFYVYDIKNETKQVFKVSDNIIKKLNNKNDGKTDLHNNEQNKKLLYNLYNI